MKKKLQVTFNESPDIRRIGDNRDKSAMKNASDSKSDRISHLQTHYTSDEAKNAYNNLMIRNFRIQAEVNGYARHFRI